MTVTYVGTLPLPATWYAALADRVPEAEVLHLDADPGAWPADVVDRVAMVHTADDVDPSRLPALRCVQLDTSGVDHLAGSALWGSPVPLVSLGGIAPVPMGEYALLGLLGLAHHLLAIDRLRARRVWPDAATRLKSLTPRAIAGSRVCIVGYGRIGREIGRLCAAFGMHVTGVRRGGGDARPQLGADRPAADAEVVDVSRLDDALADADWVVLVLPLTAGTRGLLDADRLDRMKPGAGLVNIARGGIVDEAALLERLRDGRIGGAVLDVFDSEPIGPDSPWWDEPRVLMTPHVAGLAPEYLRGTLDLVAENLRRLQHDLPLLNEVERSRGY
ncbi:D-2-hydroxyacid dehydrogenase [uncultured Amnibacterium sp.]|uniref:D-2-hydroxyacid dehydrogenase n=1 Tax=uncultured Amnibacterium sp. TaxID=1631851 RepID=UPI0035CA3896